MTEAASEGMGGLALVFGTWVYRLHAAGLASDDAEVEVLCGRIDEAPDAASGEQAGSALVNRLSVLLDGGAGPAAAAGLARRLYGDRVWTGLGEGSRAERLARIRAAQFGRSLPWLARIWERRADGEVAPSWLLVEHITDEVGVMDPNPWNDVEEARRFPLPDFLPLWELDGCTSVCLRAE